MAIRPPKRHEELRGISLCAGVGGLDLGIHIAEPGYHAVCHVERNSFAAATLVARMADQSLAAAPIWDDLRSFDGKPWSGRVHIVIAGYPCQPFSLSGHRKGGEDPRHLWPEVARIVGEVRPEWCFFENVVGHLSLGFDIVAGELQGMGYRVAACVVSAAEVGASHIRERLFILAHAHGEGDGHPRLDHSDARPRAAVSQGRQRKGQPVRDMVGSQGVDGDVGSVDRGGLDPAGPRLFAPMPGDFAEWGKALGSDPSLKPCIQRLDHGVATWMDRTAAAGNGVVPMAAARAWIVLKAALLA